MCQILRVAHRSHAHVLVLVIGRKFNELNLNTESNVIDIQKPVTLINGLLSNTNLYL